MKPVTMEAVLDLQREQQLMGFRKRNYTLLMFMLCLTCALFVFASEHSYRGNFGAHFRDVCAGDDCMLLDAVSRSSGTDVTSADKNSLPIHVIITLTNAQHKRELQSKFALTVSSLFEHCTRPVMMYIIGDVTSQVLAKNILAGRVKQTDKYEVRRILVLFSS